MVFIRVVTRAWTIREAVMVFIRVITVIKIVRVVVLVSRFVSFS
jgi:hypothetical protein